MKKVVYKALNFLLFGNIFVAFCAVAQALLTYSIIGLKPSVLVCGFLFFSTLAFYNFSLLITNSAKTVNTQNARNHWFFAHYHLNFGNTIFAALALIPFFLGLNFWAKILAFLLGGVSFGYLFPIFFIANKKLNFRNIKGLKLFLIAFVWALSVVLLPVLAAGNFIPKREILILISKQFLLFAAITIPFDVRDFFEDKASNLKTLPIIYGAKKAYWLAIILLLLNLVLVFCFKSSLFEGSFFASIITPIIAGLIIMQAGLNKKQYYYYLYLDGILILQYLFLVLYNLV